MPRTINFTHNATDWKSKIGEDVFSKQKTWMLEEIGHAHKYIVDGMASKKLPLFKAVAFHIDQFNDLRSQNRLGWLVFSLIHIHPKPGVSNTQETSTLMAFGMSKVGSESYMLSKQDDIYLGTPWKGSFLNTTIKDENIVEHAYADSHLASDIPFSDRDFRDLLSNSELNSIYPDIKNFIDSQKSSFEYTWTLDNFEKKLDEVVAKAASSSFQENNMFFFVRFEISALKEVADVPKCKNIILLPILIPCKVVKRDYNELGSSNNRFSFYTANYITLMMGALDEDNQLIPINENGKLFYFSNQSWEPRYKKW